jgi:hypothetical protein
MHENHNTRCLEKKSLIGKSPSILSYHWSKALLALFKHSDPSDAMAHDGIVASEMKRAKPTGARTRETV